MHAARRAQRRRPVRPPASLRSMPARNRLSGVDVADPDHHAAVHDEQLHRRRRPAAGLVQPGPSKAVVERLDAEAGDERVQCVASCHTTRPKRRGSRRRRASGRRRCPGGRAFRAARPARCAGCRTSQMHHQTAAGKAQQQIWRAARRRRGLAGEEVGQIGGTGMAQAAIADLRAGGDEAGEFGAMPRRVVSTSGSSGMANGALRGRGDGPEGLACWPSGKRLTSGEPNCSGAIQAHAARCRGFCMPVPGLVPGTDSPVQSHFHEAIFPPRASGPSACRPVFAGGLLAGVAHAQQPRDDGGPTGRGQGGLSGRRS